MPEPPTFTTRFCRRDTLRRVAAGAGYGVWRRYTRAGQYYALRPTMFDAWQRLTHCGYRSFEDRPCLSCGAEFTPAELKELRALQDVRDPIERGDDGWATDWPDEHKAPKWQSWRLGYMWSQVPEELRNDGTRRASLGWRVSRLRWRSERRGMRRRLSTVSGRG